MVRCPNFAENMTLLHYNVFKQIVGLN